MNSHTIVRLQGPDRVRKRPAVIFGSDGADGVRQMIELLLHIFLTEAALGHNHDIRVTLGADGGVTIASRDRGLILDETLQDGTPIWQQVFCELFSAPAQPDEEYYFSLGTQHHHLFAGDEAPALRLDHDPAFDLCCVQYASRSMRVEAVRDGVRKIAAFAQGYSVAPLSKEPTDAPHGTVISFLPDEQVFTDVTISAAAVGAALQDAAIAIPGLCCTLTDERDGTEVTYHYPNGAIDYVAAVASPVAVFSHTLSANGRDRYNRPPYQATVKVTVAFVPAGGTTLCLHNHRRMVSGGTHRDAAMAQIAKRVEWECGATDVASRLILVLESTCDAGATRYATGARSAITNPMMADMAADLMGEEFSHFLQQHAAAIAAVFPRD